MASFADSSNIVEHAIMQIRLCKIKIVVKLECHLVQLLDIQ